mmetsp:Transcript_159512/g.290983  ORF Transcript_159512/g.290983 Transcript_159512/m.290983 type:complete len:91 (+) Transcript_159512:1-273(+)
MVLMLGFLFLYLWLEAGLVSYLMYSAVAWMSGCSMRFILLQASAFEVWYCDELIYSGIDNWRPPHPNQVLQQLESRGVKVAKVQQQQAKC